MQKQNYAIAALDMDGTLLNSHHETTPYTREVIRRAAEAGKVVALSTGRCMSELKDHVRQLDAIRYIICENGACIYDAKKMESIRTVPIPEKEVEFLLDLMDRYDAVPQLFIENQSYLRVDIKTDLTPYHMEYFRSVFEAGSIFDPQLFDRWRDRKRSVEKINLYMKNVDERAMFYKELEGHPLVAADSIGIGVEISAEGVDKGCGLRMLCETLNTPLECSMAVGDGGNDIEIIRTAGLGVAMGNAIDEVKALADVVTDDNDHDGAAKAIEKYMLSE